MIGSEIMFPCDLEREMISLFVYILKETYISYNQWFDEKAIKTMAILLEKNT